MSAFDKVIGYEQIKQELMRVCDMIQHREYYDALGAKLPHGMLLHGDPGLGKTLLAKCLIEESGLDCVTVRRDVNGDEFHDVIRRAFAYAREHTPAIVFLDDMDKFANEDRYRRDAPEYVTVQSCMDECKDSEVFVLATANNFDKLPDSLVRSGRFDIKIELESPKGKDAEGIIKYYLRDKQVSRTLNYEDLVRMVSYRSCAELEQLLNDAAIRAAYQRRTSIEMEDFVEVLLQEKLNTPDYDSAEDNEDTYKFAIHEAGHLVTAEILFPGSVGMIAIRSEPGHGCNGFVHMCRELPETMNYVLVALAGKAAVEQYNAQEKATGCRDDLLKASNAIRDYIVEEARMGFAYYLPDANRDLDIPDSLNERVVTLIQAEMERCFLRVQDILLRNRAFLEAVVDALMMKKVLLHSDIQAIRRRILGESTAV